MYAKIVTTITTEIDLETMTPTHSVEVDSDALPITVVCSAAIGGCRSAIAELEKAPTRASLAEILDEKDEA